MTNWLTVNNRTPYLLYVIIAVLAVGLFWSMKTCNENKRYKDNALNDSAYVQKLDSFRNENGRLVFEQQIQKDVNDKMIHKISDSVFAFNDRTAAKIREISALLHASELSKIDTQFLPYHDVVKVDVPKYIVDPALQDSLRQFLASVIHVPQHFSIDTSKYFKIDGTIKKEGIALNNISFTDDVYYRFTKKKTGFLGLGSKTVIQAVHTSPYSTTTGMQSIIVPQKTNIWNKYVKPVLFGAAGYYVGKKLR